MRPQHQVELIAHLVLLLGRNCAQACVLTAPRAHADVALEPVVTATETDDVRHDHHGFEAYVGLRSWSACKSSCHRTARLLSCESDTREVAIRFSSRAPTCNETARRRLIRPAAGTPLARAGQANSRRPARVVSRSEFPRAPQVAAALASRIWQSTAARQPGPAEILVDDFEEEPRQALVRRREGRCWPGLGRSRPASARGVVRRRPSWRVPVWQTSRGSAARLSKPERSSHRRRSESGRDRQRRRPAAH